MNRKLCGMLSAIVLLTNTGLFAKAEAAGESAPVRYMEDLGRGVVAVSTDSGVFVSWRLTLNDSDGTKFNVYRNGTKLNTEPLSGGTNYLDTSITSDEKKKNPIYTVTAVNNSAEGAQSAGFTLQTDISEPCYVVTLGGNNRSKIHNVWVGDLDGDGEYEFVLSRQGGAAAETAEAPAEDDDVIATEIPDDSEIGSDTGYSQQLQAFESDGTLLWELDYGYNSYNRSNMWGGSGVIETGQVDGITVYDIDRDGKAEVITKITNGAKLPADGLWMEETDDRCQEIAVLDGMTGKLKAHTQLPTDYKCDAGGWLIQYGIGYMDGETPTLYVNMKNRGTKNQDLRFHQMFAAYTMNGTELKREWKYDATSFYDYTQLDGHQMRIADVDGDGCDELCEIGFVIDNDGTLLYNMFTEENFYVLHGDRFYVGAFEKNSDHMNGYGIQQKNIKSGLLEYYYNAKTGRVEIAVKNEGDKIASTGDVGRGDIADIDPNHPGWEFYSFQGVYSPDELKGKDYDTKRPSPTPIVNPAPSTEYKPHRNGGNPWPAIALWWNGDLLRENCVSSIIERFCYTNNSQQRQVTMYHYPKQLSGVSASLNGRNVPLFVGDFIGDWREEVIMRGSDDAHLVVFTTSDTSPYRFYTLAQDPLYRNCMTIKGYVESHQLDYYLGSDMYSETEYRESEDISKRTVKQEFIPRPANAAVLTREHYASPSVLKLKLAKPYKLVYAKGDSFDSTGMSVTAVMAGGAENKLSAEDYELTGFDSSSAGTKKLTISYNGVTADFYIMVCDADGIVYNEDFETNYDSEGSYTGNVAYSVTKGNVTAGTGTDAAVKNANETKIFSIGGNDGYGLLKWQLPEIETDYAELSFDFRMDAIASGKNSALYLCGYTGDFNDSSKSLMQIIDTASSNGRWGSIIVSGNGVGGHGVNRVDITEKAKIQWNGKDNNSDSQAGCGLKRDSTGWLNMNVRLDYEHRQSDITIKRISDDSVVWSGTVPIDSDFTRLKQVRISMGDTYGGASVDNIVYKVQQNKSEDIRRKITPAQAYDYTNDETKDYPDAKGFYTQASGSGRISWYLSKDGGEKYTFLMQNDTTITTEGAVSVGMIIYNMPANLKNKSVTAGYTIE